MKLDELRKHKPSLVEIEDAMARLSGRILYFKLDLPGVGYLEQWRTKQMGWISATPDLSFTLTNESYSPDIAAKILKLIIQEVMNIPVSIALGVRMANEFRSYYAQYKNGLLKDLS